jgi:hypothetical protein
MADVKRVFVDCAAEVGQHFPMTGHNQPGRGQFAEAALKMARESAEGMYYARQDLFKAAAVQHGLEIVKMLPEMQRRNKVERTHHT